MQKLPKEPQKNLIEFTVTTKASSYIYIYIYVRCCVIYAITYLSVCHPVLGVGVPTCAMNFSAALRMVRVAMPAVAMPLERIENRVDKYGKIVVELFLAQIIAVLWRVVIICFV